ncbi:MAG: YhbY family RNA-binding protein [Promethearchaeota archaeon]
MGYHEDFKKVLLGDPHCILGKKGLTVKFLEHVSALLKQYKIIKIKVLKSIADNSNIKALAEDLSQKTDSHLLDIRGKTFIISKYPIKKKN